MLSLALGGVMRKLLVAAGALAWLCAALPANAADQRPAPLKAPPVAIAPWSGFYLGLDAGFQSTRTDLTLISIATVGGVLGPQTIPPGGATSLPYDGTGARFGAFGGYNWQASPQWVFGAEADLGWTDNKTTLNGVAIPAFFCCANIGHSSSVSTNWDASVRGRLGFLVTPTFMVYLTGGVAWQRFETNSSCGAPFCAPVPPPGVTFVPFSITNAFTKTGYTVGGGFETMLWPNWFLRASYRYAEFGTVSFDVTNAVTGGVAAGTTFITSTMDLKLRTHTASFGVAYKFGESAATAYAADRSAMPVKGPIYKAPPAPPVSWTGFYLGLDVGLRSTHTDVITTSALINGVPNDFTNFATEEPLNKTSIRFGSYAGYNWHAAPLWVVGIEVDAGSAERDATLPGFPFTPGFLTSGIATDGLSVKTTWDASARGRIGYLLSPTVLGYVTGGAAWLHYDVTSACPGACALPIFALGPFIISNSATRTGWTAGGAFEALLWSRWFARAEYRYADFGTESFTTVRTGTLGLITSVVDNFDVKVRTHTFKFGLAYKFTD